jgi:hypothetical protein
MKGDLQWLVVKAMACSKEFLSAERLSHHARIDSKNCLQTACGFTVSFSQSKMTFASLTQIYISIGCYVSSQSTTYSGGHSELQATKFLLFQNTFLLAVAVSFPEFCAHSLTDLVYPPRHHLNTITLALSVMPLSNHHLFAPLAIIWWSDSLADAIVE